MGGFILIARGASSLSQPSLDTQSSLGYGFSGLIHQIQGYGLIYGGLAAVMLGILLIWALVKSGQIENIDKNIQVIADWARSQMQKEALITKELPEDDTSNN